MWLHIRIFSLLIQSWEVYKAFNLTQYNYTCTYLMNSPLPNINRCQVQHTHLCWCSQVRFTDKGTHITFHVLDHQDTFLNAQIVQNIIDDITMILQSSYYSKRSWLYQLMIIVHYLSMQICFYWPIIRFKYKT